MRRRLLVVAAAGLVAAGVVSGQGETRVRVTGQRVNLRAKASLQSEVVGQVADGEVLAAKSFQDEWVEVAPPDTLDLWVHREFVKDNMVTAARLYVRAGPGINFSVVGTLGRNEAIVPRGDFGEWIKIVPPPSSSLWLNRTYVQVLEPEKVKPPVVLPPASVQEAAKPEAPASPEPQAAAPAAPAATAPAPAARAAPLPADLALIPVEGQGRVVQREGMLRLAGFVIGRPSRFRLVRYQGNRVETLCYVRGNTQQLNSFLGKRLLIRGREYWVRGVGQPVVIPDQIFPRAAP